MNEDRFKEALDAIQEAQLLANRACRALCSVREGSREETAYGLACALSDQIKATWHKIEQHRQQHDRMGAELPRGVQVRDVDVKLDFIDPEKEFGGGW